MIALGAVANAASVLHDRGMSKRGAGAITPVLVIAAIVVLGIVAVRQLVPGADALHAMRAATIGLLIVWLLLETPLAFRASSDDQRGEDRGTIRINGLARGAALVASLAWPPVWTSWNWIQTAGVLLFVAGFVFRLAAIRELGRFYSHTVRRTDGHETIENGPYRVVRHPAYLGVIAAHLGFAVVFLNVLSALAVLFLVVPAFVWRIHVEEPVLMKIPGYPQYARGHARLIPKIW
jgi:protein-S-isoprenylcysteine O-methyltransferase Ste14